MYKFNSMAKKYIKAVSCATVALSMLVLGFISAYSEDTPLYTEAVKGEESGFFEDVKATDWFYPYVSFLSENNVIKGKTETEFCPDDSLSVAELAALIVRYHDLDARAQECREELTALGYVGSELWYSGYIDLMLEGEILLEGEFGISSLDGRAIIGESSKRLLDGAVTREQAARMIARSFETDGTDFLSEACPGDVSKHGHNFIVGGGYSLSLLDTYGELIKDYDEIGHDYVTDVKKCYYNGIFSGDEKGAFNPKNSLTRAEASKIIACTMDFSLRIREEYRSIDSELSYVDNTYVLDEASKEKLLSNTAKSAVAKDGVLYITLENNVPYGYYIEVLVSRELYGHCYTAYRYGLMTAAADFPSYPVNIDVKITYNSQPCIIRALYILRDMTVGGDITATFEAIYTTDGGVSYSADVK